MIYALDWVNEMTAPWGKHGGEIHRQLVVGRAWRHWCSLGIRLGIILLASPIAIACTRDGGGGLQANATGVTEIESEALCPGCRLTFKRLATLGASGDVLLSGDARIDVDSRGRFVVAPTTTPGEIVLYDASGVLVKRLGKPGEGPGEFLRINRVKVGPGDSIHIFEGSRHSVIAPGLTHFVRTELVPVRPQKVSFLEDGRMILQAMVTNIDGISDPVHITDGHAEISQSIGGVEPWEGQPYSGFRAVAPTSDNRLWLGRVNQYRLELWDTSGVLLDTFVRNIQWFRPWREEDLRGQWDGFMRPRLVDIREDSVGRLWVILQVVDPDWTPPDPRAETPTSSFRGEDAFDNYIEVIDVRSKRVIGRWFTELALPSFIGEDGLSFTTRVAPMGNTLLDIWRLEVVNGE